MRFARLGQPQTPAKSPTSSPPDPPTPDPPPPAQLLTTGGISKAPPIATLTDAELRAADVQEGFTVDLHPAASIPAVVSFTPGVERRVFFSIAGVAPRRGADADSGERALLRSLPVTVVADPSPTKPGTGVVLSVAPLLGADPTIDRNVGKWLHIHVRPSVRGLLRVLKVGAGGLAWWGAHIAGRAGGRGAVCGLPSPQAGEGRAAVCWRRCTRSRWPWVSPQRAEPSRPLPPSAKPQAASSKKGGLLNSLRQLADGHWVLAFGDAERSAAAKLLVYQHSVALREAYSRHLEPLTGGPQPRRNGGSGGGGEAAVQQAGEPQEQQQQQQRRQDQQQQDQQVGEEEEEKA